MALEHYTRGQKLFMAAFIIVLAATFTVTGAMITLFGQGGETAPINQGIFDGREIRLVEFQRIRRALGIIQHLDGNVQPWTTEPPEQIYARVPAMSPRPEFGHDWPYLATQPRTVSLLDLWPRYQDQDVWCHIALAVRARDAGVQVPSNAYVGAVLTALINNTRQETEHFAPAQLQRRFPEIYGASLDEIVPTVREALMVRDYVASLLADESARLDQIARIHAGNRSELKAEVMRLRIEPFMEQARRDVLRERFAYQASRVAAGFGVAGVNPGYDRFEEAFDLNSRHLHTDARFRFEIIKAFPEDMVERGQVPFEEGMARLVYLAVRDEVYRAGDRDRADIEGRLDRAENRKSQDPATANWDEARWAAWREEQRPMLMQYRVFEEVQAELNASLRRKEALRASEIGITSLLSFLEERRRERERLLNAELEVVTKEKAVWDGKKRYLEGLRRRFDSLERQLHARLRGAGNRLHAIEVTDESGRDRALNRVIEDAARDTWRVYTEQVESLLAEAGQAAQDLERSLGEHRARLEEFTLQEEKKNADGLLMTEEEVRARTRQLELEIEAVEARILLRDAKLELVREFAEDIKARLAHYSLIVRDVEDDDFRTRFTVLEHLLVEIPVSLGILTAEARDRITPESEVDEYAGQADLIQADLTARRNSLRKDAADTRELNFAAIIGGINERFGIGLSLERPLGSYTWESLIGNEDYLWLENVEGARSFLEDASNHAGSTSGVLTMPGRGYVILRIMEKTPRHDLGRAEAHDRVVTIAAMRRARELAVEALRDIRREVIDNGWDAAASGAERFGDAFEIVTTPWFRENMDIPGIYSINDTDVLNVSGSPSTTSPEQPFISRLRDIKPNEGITDIIPERRNPDPLRRPDRAQWSYLLARVTDRREAPRRLDEEAMKDQGTFGASPPAELWRNRHLAASDIVRNLIEPAKLLAPHTIYRFPLDRREAGNEEE